MSIKLVIKGRPITKKNSSRMIPKIRKVLPSKAYQAYEESAGWQLKGKAYKIDKPVKVVCRYWMPNRASWPDLVGLLQATSDILEKYQVILNDRQIVSYGDSRIVGIDKDNPRVEIMIEECESICM